MGANIGGGRYNSGVSGPCERRDLPRKTREHTLSFWGARADLPSSLFCRCSFKSQADGHRWDSSRTAFTPRFNFCLETLVVPRGTESSNPAPSSGESRANLASCLTAGTSTDCDQIGTSSPEHVAPRLPPHQ